MKNLEIANLFYHIADILEMRNVQWKPRAYRRAAQAIESLSEPIEEIYKKGGKKALMEIPGIGASLAEHIEEYLKTGEVKEFNELLKKTPKGVEEMMHLEGLGPKKVQFLFQKLKIKSIKELEEAVKKHKLAGLPGFGKKTEENILRAIEFYRKGQERTLLGIALPIAQEIVEKLRKLKEVNSINYAGSLRRMKETIGDIDILVTSSNPQRVMDFFTTMPDVLRIIAKGKTKSTVILKGNMQADVRVVDDKSFGAALQYFTGSKEHNIKLREIAIKKGYKLSEYGLFDKKTNKYIAGRTEEEVYKKLGLPYIEPELRENLGEIEAAQKGKLPKLIGYNDVKGDFHVHSKWSDGSDEIEDIAKAAIKQGYEYLCLTDHSKTRAIAHGLSEDDLKKQWREIDKVNAKLKNFRILKGTELDILSDGSLDYDDEVLKKFDIVVASVHSGFKMSEKEMTKRIVRALESKYVDILGHPTGRLINQRAPYQVDMDAVLNVAKENEKIVEINAHPERLDLKDVHIRAALEKGIKLAIGTDSHSVEHLKFINYGIAQARRGWAEKKDIINTLPLKELPKYFKKLRL